MKILIVIAVFVWVLALAVVFGVSAKAAMEPEEIMVRLATGQPVPRQYGRFQREVQKMRRKRHCARGLGSDCRYVQHMQWNR